MRRYFANLWAAICGRSVGITEDRATIHVYADTTQAMKAIGDLEAKVKALPIALATPDEYQEMAAILAEAHARFTWEHPVAGETHKQAHDRYHAIVREIREMAASE